MLHLAFHLSFEDLYSSDGLERLDAAFVAFLGEADTALRDRLIVRIPPLAGNR